MVFSVPVANVPRSPIGCPRDEFWWEVKGGFVLMRKAWAGSLTGAAIDGLFLAAFGVGDRGWVLDGDVLWLVGPIVRLIKSAVSVWVTVAG